MATAKLNPHDKGVETCAVAEMKTWPKMPKAWKIVDAEYADAVAKGILKIGTLAGYAAIENGRADAMEGRLDIHVDLEPDDPGHAEKMKRLEWAFGGGESANNIRITNTVLHEEAEGCWAFCMTEVGCTFDPDETKKPKAIFEISDVLRLAGLLREGMGWQVREAYSGPVTYEPRVLDLRDALDAGPHPFFKDTFFSPEREVRIVMPPAEGVVADGPRFTGANSRIASLFTRLHYLG